MDIVDRLNNPNPDECLLAIDDAIAEIERLIAENAQLRKTWPANDIRRAFVEGAAWWEYHQQNATMWQSDRRIAEAEAEMRYPGCNMVLEEDAMRKSISKYTDDWPEISLAAKKAAGWKCERCSHEHDTEAHYVLTVHHLTLDPANNAWWNLAVLCQRCHLHIQGRVIMERLYMFEHSEWFKPHVAGYYAAIYGHPTDRDWVMDNLSMLLDYGRPS
jgi:hypothetical protein